MGVNRQEKDRRLSKEGFEDSSVPAGEKIDEESWKEKGGNGNGRC